MADTNKILAVSESEGRKLNIAGGEYRIVVSGKQTNGAFAVIEMTVPPGAGPNPHEHPDFEESFFVLEGKISFKSEAGSYVAKQNSFVNIPKGGIVHGFKNLSNNPAKLLCTVIPAGLDDFFSEASDLMAIAKAESYQPTQIKEKLDVISEKYGQTLYGPDYLD